MHCLAPPTGTTSRQGAPSVDQQSDAIVQQSQPVASLYDHSMLDGELLYTDMLSYSDCPEVWKGAASSLQFMRAC